jgi:hypothetical protein
VLVGARLSGRDADRLALGLAGLNLAALGFAVAEFRLGVPAFYPLSPVTEIIYKSNDALADRTAMRIPACFANSHAYAGCMVATLPWLIGALARPQNRGARQWLLAAGVVAALVGNFLAATRVNMGLVALIVLVTTFSGQLRFGAGAAWIVMLGGVVYLVSNEARLQRFLTLRDTGMIVDRVQVSVSMLELVLQYPLGNGMGAGGTSIPGFLQPLLSDVVVFESEYCRLVLEQGIPGLVLWFAFLGWIALRPPFHQAPWSLGRRLLWVSTLTTFLIGAIGSGLMTTVPSSVLFFLGAGFVAAVPVSRRPRPRPTPSAGTMLAGKPDDKAIAVC